MSVKINNARDILNLPPLNFRRYSPEPNQWKQPEEEGPTTSRPFDKSDDDGIYDVDDRGYEDDEEQHEDEDEEVW